MSGFENIDFIKYESIRRQLEEMVTSLDSNIVKVLSEDEALIMQAYSGETAALLCNKYRQFVAEINSLNNELTYHIEKIESDLKHSL